ncbi:DUF4365 domain-containing protein [Actinoplanes sp. LDG1-06]|uniref:DUF4365 domain-containing protein n=1 Tax=Paractinoplanes ovalisporus TaxID=2810368 RepID=A0ABS2AMR7_9ACTN|nr:DUF4365 domain-containing protein [Actinoplanes ovalisporus]MBM2620494.1 DUF4365 domain-containing protein [Actinoplanes ovalisporus]
MNIVEGASLSIGWFFREQEVSDQGIDAHVEKAMGEVGTGRLLAIQIKSGPSYFSEPVEGGWTFRFDAKKAKLWLNHALPVIVVLVDTEQRECYWQAISSRTVSTTGKGYKVLIPRSNEVLEADLEWTELASGIQSRAENLFDFALTQLPPSVGTKLTNASPNEHLDLAILALHLAEGRNNPQGTVESLLAASPGWIQRQAPKSWEVLAAYSAEHGLPELSAEAFDLAAQADPARAGKLWAIASINVLYVNRTRAEFFLTRSVEMDPVSLELLVAKALFEHPLEDARPLIADKSLERDSPQNRSSYLVQSFLAEQATRSGDPEAACRHARVAIEVEPQNSEAMLAYADKLLRRSRSGMRQVGDLVEAVRHLEMALAQRRSWAGPTIPVLLVLIKAYGLNGQFNKVLTVCTLAPRGSANADEASNKDVCRQAVLAAWASGQRAMAEDLSHHLGDELEDKVVKVHAGLLVLTTQELSELWNAEISRAIAAKDYEAIAKSAIELASLGHDKRSVIRPFVDASIIPESYIHLIDALVVASSDLDAAVPKLRSLARGDSTAAEFLMVKLAAAGRLMEAADNCQALFEYSHEPYLLISRAQLLIEAGSETAELAARIAIDITSGFPAERAGLLTFLGKCAADRDMWEEAEKLLTQALEMRPLPTSDDVWRIVLAQVNQGRLSRAAQTISAHKPTVVTVDEARLWLQANSAVPWGEAIASEALTLAQRINDPVVSTALLGNIVMRTHGVQPEGESGQAVRSPDTGEDLEERRRLAQLPVSADLHVQAFAALQDLVEQFGEATGVTVLNGDPVELVKHMKSGAQLDAEDASQLLEVVQSARDGRIPRAFLASLRGASYTTMLVQRTLGYLVSGASDEGEHDRDIKAANEAIGGAVVVDASTLCVLSGPVNSGSLEGQFMRILASSGTLRDIHRAALDIRGFAGSPGTLGWDSARNAATFWSLDDSEYLRQLRRVQAVEDFSERVSSRVVSHLSLFDNVPHGPMDDTWTEPIQLAHDGGFALWSDDIGLRRLARQFNIPCFGTPALIDCLRDRRILDNRDGVHLQLILSETAALNRAIASDMIVDVPLHLEDLLVMAEQDQWRPRAGALVLSRPSWWAWQTQPIRDLLVFYKVVGQNDPDSLSEWQYAAMVGAARSLQVPEVASKLLAYIGLVGFGNGIDAEVAVEGLKQARRVAVDSGLPDPVLQVPAAIGTMATAGGIERPVELTEYILERIDQLGAEQ